MNRAYLQIFARTAIATGLLYGIVVWIINGSLHGWSRDMILTAVVCGAFFGLGMGALFAQSVSRALKGRELRATDIGWLGRSYRAQVELPFAVLEAMDLVKREMRAGNYREVVDSSETYVVIGWPDAPIKALGYIRATLTPTMPLAAGTTRAQIESMPGLRMFMYGFARDKYLVDELAIALNQAVNKRLQEVREAAEAAALRSQLDQARLGLLQAQVEPHFLYNTLANLQLLIRSDAGAADRMTSDLIGYLRLSMPEFRGAGFTLGRELELVRAYLNIMKIRLGDRLDFTIRGEDVAGEATFPPLLIHTLVENAIKHGIEPRPGGGAISIDAGHFADAEGRLRIVVADTGIGLQSESQGTGVGLANLRERVDLLYGKQASFTIAPNEPHGLVCTLEVPLERPGAA